MLQPGDPEYRAYVGPPEEYDLMGATQFRLLCALGLRSHHRLLDMGCGSLRAGRLLIPHLDAGNYCGIEPNAWLVEEGIAHNLGSDVITKKQPRFAHRDDFSADDFGGTFDFVLAQSILSHTGQDLTAKAILGIKDALASDGVAAVTFVECRWPASDFKGSGWAYPDVLRYRPSTIRRMIAESGLSSVRIAWHHPRQRWWLLAHAPERLPGRLLRRRLDGMTILQPAADARHRAFARGMRILRERRPSLRHKGDFADARPDTAHEPR